MQTILGQALSWERHHIWGRHHSGIGTVLRQAPSSDRHHTGTGTVLGQVPSCGRHRPGTGTILEQALA